MHLGVAILPLAAAASWGAGALWYRLFGRTAAAALGRDPDQPGARPPLRAMLFSFFAESVMAVIFVVVIGPLAFEGSALRAFNGVVVGGVLWLGFVVTSFATTYAYRGSSLALLAIDAGHWLLVLLIQGALIAGLR